MNTRVIVSSALFLLIEEIAPTRPLCTRCVFNVDDKNSCSNASSSLVESDCVSIEVNIVEEEQNMWRRIKKGTKFQLDAGRRSALLLSTQQVIPHFVAESLITSTVKDALSRTLGETFPASSSPTQRSA